MILLMVACSEPDPLSISEAETLWITDLSYEVSEAIPTAIKIRFTTAEEGWSWVEVDGVATGQTSPNINHEHIIYGAPLQDLTVVVVAESDGERHESEEFTVTTGQLLPETPTLEVTVDALSGKSHLQDAVLVAHLYGDPTSWTLITNMEGQVIWAMSQDSQGLGVIPALDRGGLMENIFHGKETHSASLRGLNLMGEVLVEIPTPGAHHFFDLVDGEPLWLRSDSRRVDAQMVTGDAIVWGDTEIFSTWDHLTHTPVGSSPFSVGTQDWTHANWIQYDDDRDTLLLSLGHHNAIVELAMDGTPQRIMGALDSDYTPDPGNDAFKFPHGVHWVGEEMVLMSTFDGLSEVRQYEMDDDTMLMTRTWDFGADYGWQVYALGEAQQLWDGNMLVSWGSVGVVQVVGLDGEVLWEAHSGLGMFFTQVYLLETRFSPRP